MRKSKGLGAPPRPGAPPPPQRGPRAPRAASGGAPAPSRRLLDVTSRAARAAYRLETLEQTNFNDDGIAGLGDSGEAFYIEIEGAPGEPPIRRTVGAAAAVGGGVLGVVGAARAAKGAKRAREGGGAGAGAGGGGVVRRGHRRLWDVLTEAIGGAGEGGGDGHVRWGAGAGGGGSSTGNPRPTLEAARRAVEMATTPAAAAAAAAVVRYLAASDSVPLPTAPPRRYCIVCGYAANYSCMRCGARTCSGACMGGHAEICDKH